MSKQSTQASTPPSAPSALMLKLEDDYNRYLADDWKNGNTLIRVRIVLSCLNTRREKTAKDLLIKTFRDGDITLLPIIKKLDRRTYIDVIDHMIDNAESPKVEALAISALKLTERDLHQAALGVYSLRPCGNSVCSNSVCANLPSGNSVKILQYLPRDVRENMRPMGNLRRALRLHHKVELLNNSTIESPNVRAYLDDIRWITYYNKLVTCTEFLLFTDLTYLALNASEQELVTYRDFINIKNDNPIKIRCTSDSISLKGFNILTRAMDDIDIITVLSYQRNLIDNVESADTYIVPFEISGLDRDYKVSRYLSRIERWIIDWNRIRLTPLSLISNIEIDDSDDSIPPAVKSLLRYRRHLDTDDISALEELELNDTTLHLFKISYQHEYHSIESTKARASSMTRLPIKYIITRPGNISYRNRGVSDSMKLEIIREIVDELKALSIQARNIDPLDTRYDTNAGLFQLSDISNVDSLRSVIQAIFELFIQTEWLSNPRILEIMLRLTMGYTDTEKVHYTIHHSMKLWEAVMANKDYPNINYKYYTSITNKIYPNLTYMYYTYMEFSYLGIFAALYHSSKLQSKRQTLLMILKELLSKSKTHMYDLILRIGALEYEPYEIMFEGSHHLERYRKYKPKPGDTHWPFHSFIMEGITNFKDDLYHDPMVTLAKIFSDDARWPLVGINEANSLINYLDLNREQYTGMMDELEGRMD